MYAFSYTVYASMLRGTLSLAYCVTNTAQVHKYAGSVCALSVSFICVRHSFIPLNAHAALQGNARWQGVHGGEQHGGGAPSRPEVRIGSIIMCKYVAA